MTQVLEIHIQTINCQLFNYCQPECKTHCKTYCNTHCNTPKVEAKPIAKPIAGGKANACINENKLQRFTLPYVTGMRFGLPQPASQARSA